MSVRSVRDVDDSVCDSVRDHRGGDRLYVRKEILV